MPAYLFYNPIDNEDTMRLYRQGLTDEEIAHRCRLDTQQISKWRWRRGLPANIKEEEDDDKYPADIKKCMKCAYWQGIHSFTAATKCCHHLLITGRCREKGEGKECLSYTARLPRNKNKEIEYGAEDDFDQHAWEQDSGGY